jgi:DNA-directed RNA polymerase subunit RPC12/RpoP
MGIYDTVVVRCPKCGAEVEFQSKAGPCSLNVYSMYEAPPEVQVDISGRPQVCECGHRVTLHAQTIITLS